MYKLSTDCICWINDLIDRQTPLDDNDREFIAASIIQGTPRSELPSVHDMEKSDELLDLLAGYMKSRSCEDGQYILDYLVNNIIGYYKPIIENIIQDKVNETDLSKKEMQEEINYQLYRWNKERL